MADTPDRLGFFDHFKRELIECLRGTDYLTRVVRDRVQAQRNVQFWREEADFFTNNVAPPAPPSPDVERVQHRTVRFTQFEISEEIVIDAVGEGRTTRLRGVRNAGGMPSAPNAEATARSWKLLESNLSQVQREQLKESSSILVVGSATRATYRIRVAYSYNVDRLNENGVIVNTYCAVPHGWLPLGDIMLAQKLMIELDEPHFLSIANTTTYDSYLEFHDADPHLNDP